ncbi:hypothetical protein [Agromyces mariniharenae]|uniref:hypothetical protein n=1 Tax=Agromyces mariniharenae TaxID=2604423 RepID=UPI0016530BD6|nr:hypothetical protein [Agromyces mariniharenae]
MSTTTSEHVPPSVDDDGPVSSEHLARAESADDSFADAPPVIEDGAISDARHHARQRRSRITLIVVASAVVVAGGIAAFFSDTAGSRVAAPEPNGPPAADAPASAATVKYRWARIHVGWAYVYDDGLVLSYADRPPIRARHLSPLGMTLLSDGVFDAEDLVGPAGTVPAEAWADERSGAYRATEYALCHLAKVPAPEPDFLTDVGTIAMKLPRPVRALLEHADVRSFTQPVLDEDGRFVGIDGHHGDPGPGVDCHVMSADLVRAIWAHTRPDLGQTEQDVRFRTDDSAFATMDGIDGSEMILISIPIMPHGGWVLWGG